jgi:biopolymer transport protein TolR
MPAVTHRGRGRRTINEINMVPFIDVMLVLLIIFMVTAPLIAPSMIDLPSVDKGKKPPPLIIEVVVNKDDSLAMRVKGKTTSINLKDLSSTIKSTQVAENIVAATDSAVVISADKNVKYESVVKVMNTLQRAGIQRIGLSVQLAN